MERKHSCQLSRLMETGEAALNPDVESCILASNMLKSPVPETMDAKWLPADAP